MNPVLGAAMRQFNSTGKGRLFMIFSEPDIDIPDFENGRIRVKVQRLRQTQ